MAIMVGVGRGATAGILIKNAETLELMQKVNVIVVDKTGTLTEGKPKVMVVMAAEGWEESAVLQTAASLERNSEHPLASAIVSAAAGKGLKLDPVTNFESLTGRGIRGVVQGKRVALEGKAAGSSLLVRAEELRREGQTVVFVFVEDAVVGLIGIADPIKSSTPNAVREMKEQGLHLVMLTGDNRITAEAVARKLGIADVRAEVAPAEKIAVVKDLQGKGRVVAMAGDGVNDAPALAQADVGIAMGAGTDVAMESAGITLLRGDLQGILHARQLSRSVMRNVRQNLVLAFLYNVLGVPIAAGVLYPVAGLLLNPMIASAAMTFSSLSVIGNALRLRKVGL